MEPRQADPAVVTPVDSRPLADHARSQSLSPESVQALIAKWRRIADQHEAQDSLAIAYAHRNCADELSALLTSAQEDPKR